MKQELVETNKKLAFYSVFKTENKKAHYISSQYY